MGRLNKTDHGHVTYVDPGSDKPVYVAKTKQCVHCGGHFVIPPSGRYDGLWCQSCNGPCHLECGECVPVEQLLENLEHGRPLNYRPIIGAVPRSIE